MNKVDLWRILRLVCAISLLAIYPILWAQTIGDPSLRSRADFVSFYAAGRIAQEQGFAKIYDLGLQKKIEEDVAGFPLDDEQSLPFMHMPYLALLLRFTSIQDYLGSYILWAFILILIYVVGAAFFLKSFFAQRDAALFIGIITFFPLFASLLQGQDTAFLFLGIALWNAGIIKQKEWYVASGLALVTLRPHLCIVLAMPLLFCYRKAWWRFAALAGSLALVSVFMLGAQGVRGFLNILAISASGEGYGTSESAMINLLGCLVRLLPFVEAGSLRAFAWVGYAFGIGLVVVMWIRSANKFDERLLGASVLAAMFFVPHLHYHDLTLVIFPLMFVTRRALEESQYPWARLIPFGASFVLLFANSSAPWIYFSMPYVLYAAFAWVLYDFGKTAPTAKILAAK